MAAPTITQKDTTFTKIFVGGLPYHTTGMLWIFTLFSGFIDGYKVMSLKHVANFTG